MNDFLDHIALPIPHHLPVELLSLHQCSSFRCMIHQQLLYICRRSRISVFSFSPRLTFELTGVQKQSEAALLHVRVERFVMRCSAICQSRAAVPCLPKNDRRHQTYVNQLADQLYQRLGHNDGRRQNPSVRQSQGKRKHH